MKRRKQKERCEVRFRFWDSRTTQWLSCTRAVRTGDGNELHFEVRMAGEVAVGYTRDWRLVPADAPWIQARRYAGRPDGPVGRR